MYMINRLVAFTHNYLRWRMAGSIIMVTFIHTVMLSERVPVLLAKLTVIVPLPSSALKVTASNSMVTSGATVCISKEFAHVKHINIKYSYS